MKNTNYMLVAAIFLLIGVNSCKKVDDIVVGITDKQKAMAVLHSLETGDSSAALKFVDPNYIQHNLYVPTGRAAFINFIQQTKTWGLKVTFKRVVAEGQYVFLHSEYNAGAANASTSFDVFRFDKGRIVEHWDNGQGNITPTLNGHTLIDGSTAIVDWGKTAVNKAKVKMLMDTVFINGKISRLPDYVSPGIIQHDPYIADGLAGLQAADSVFANYHYVSIFKLIAEGNFILSMAKGTYKDKDAGLYNLFRLENGKVVEHWDIVEFVPDPTQWQNTNGKF